MLPWRPTSAMGWCVSRTLLTRHGSPRAGAPSRPRSEPRAGARSARIMWSPGKRVFSSLILSCGRVCRLLPSSALNRPRPDWPKRSCEAAACCCTLTWRSSRSPAPVQKPHGTMTRRTGRCQVRRSVMSGWRWTMCPKTRPCVLCWDPTK